MYVYLLESTSGKTYIGATTDVARRLRQHNKEISGGANYTGRWVSRGETWSRICYVSGFPSWIDALQFEWKWKRISRESPSKNGLQRRLEALNVLLASDKSTRTSLPFKEWVIPPQIHDS